MGKEATNKINYQGKIVISEGRKAKVLKDAQNELTIIFQKKGKYQGGNIATVKKGEVSFLDKRKHPEKVPLSVEAKKVEDAMNEFLNAWGDSLLFDLFNEYLRKGPEVWSDIISAYKKELLNLTKEDYLTNLEKFTTKLQEKPGDSFWFNLFNLYLKKGEKTWMDVSKYKGQLPDLTKKHYSAKLEDTFNELQKKPGDSFWFDLFNEHLKKAQEAWVDVSAYKGQLPDLTKKHYSAKLEDDFNELQKNPKDYTGIHSFKILLESAQEAWVDVSAYKEKVPDLTKKYYSAKLEEDFNEVQKNPQNFMGIVLFETQLRFAEEAWVDVKKYKDFLNTLKKG